MDLKSGHHHWKAVDAAKNCKKGEYESIAQRWKDDPSCRDTQNMDGRSRTACSWTTSRRSREQDRCTNQLVLRCKIRRTQVRCQFTIFLKCGENTCNDGLLLTRTRKRQHSSTSKIQTEDHCEKNASNGVISVEPRRCRRHPQRHDGILKNV